MNYLLDTCVISELVAKQPNPQVVAWIDRIEETRLYLSVITIGEKGQFQSLETYQKQSGDVDVTNHSNQGRRGICISFLLE